MRCIKNAAAKQENESTIHIHARWVDEWTRSQESWKMEINPTKCTQHTYTHTPRRKTTDKRWNIKAFRMLEII